MTTSKTKPWLLFLSIVLLNSCSEMTELGFYLTQKAPIEEIAQQTRADWSITSWHDPRLMDSQVKVAWLNTPKANQLFDNMMTQTKGRMGRLQSTSWIKTSSKSISLRLCDDTTIEYEAKYNDILYFHQKKMYQRGATPSDKALFDYLDSEIYSKESTLYKQQFAQLLKASQSGDTDAMIKLSTYYLRGYGTAINKQKAYQYLQQAADAGNHDAMAQLASVYYYQTSANQYNLEPNRDLSFAYAQKLAAQGYSMGYGSFIRKIYEESQHPE